MTKNIAFQPTTQSPEEAVQQLLEAIREQQIFFVAFDLKTDQRSAPDLARWILKFKELYHKDAIQQGKAATLPSIAVFADGFNSEEKKQFRQTGAILFDRSLDCNQDCQTPKQLGNWLAKNKIGLDELRPSDPSTNGISPEDIQNLNELPANMTNEKPSHILKILNSQSEERKR